MSKTELGEVGKASVEGDFLIVLSASHQVYVSGSSGVEIHLCKRTKVVFLREVLAEVRVRHPAPDRNWKYAEVDLFFIHLG